MQQHGVGKCAAIAGNSPENEQGPTTVVIILKLNVCQPNQCLNLSLVEVTRNCQVFISYTNSFVEYQQINLKLTVTVKGLTRAYKNNDEKRIMEKTSNLIVFQLCFIDLRIFFPAQLWMAIAEIIQYNMIHIYSLETFMFMETARFRTDPLKSLGVMSVLTDIGVADVGTSVLNMTKSGMQSFVNYKLQLICT